MMNIRLAAVAVCATLTACAQQPPTPASSPAPARSEAKPQPKVVVAKPVPRKPPLPAQDLTDEILFKLMLAEIAAQRGQSNVAVSALLELARETHDPRIAQRATEVAWNARYVSAALEAAALWLQADPESTQARQVLATLLVSQAQLADAKPHLEKWIAADPDGIGQSFLQLSSLLARHKDKAEVAKLMQGLAQAYPDVPEAHLAVAQAALDADELALALEEARTVLKLRPDWELAALFYAQVLQRRSNAEAIQYLADYLKTHPGAKDARLNYARLLVSEKNFSEARKQFEVLLTAVPQNADVTMAVAMLAVQAKDYDAAESQFRHLLEINYKDPDAVRLYLGQINEDRERYGEALKWYGSIGPGDQFINSRARYAGVLAKQGHLAAARDYLQKTSAQDSQQRVRLVQAEAQLLRDAHEYQEAFNVLGAALAKQPDTPDLLYDHAMAAEKVNRIDVLETNLRQLIKTQPGNAHAYNALGYTLADRNERLTEAHELIETALKLAPEDPFIMDSMGWVLFRMGQDKAGLVYLQRAFELRPDAEIAGHLGEVLWHMGQREQAQKIWSEMLKANPKNEMLQNTIKRFDPSLL